MNASVVLTIVCDDRPGIVKSLSRLLEQHEGNWTESSMLSLAGKFAGILLASLPEARVEGFLSELAGLESEGMQIVAQRSGDTGVAGGEQEFTLELVGQDRPGIVHDITDILSRHGVNVLELETGCESASMSAEVLFRAVARIRIAPDTSMDALQADIENLANELMVDITVGS